MTDPSPILKTNDIYMAFGRVDVLRDIHFEIYPGEVHGLVGENGAGKSTLAKIIAGVHQPRSGTIQISANGGGLTEVQIPNPHAATQLGIALIHQEPLTFPELDVAENIFIGRQPVSRGVRRVDWAGMYRRSEEILQSLGVNLDSHQKVRGLSIADQQMVEMAGALSQDARVLLMDEPTAALTPNEVDELFKIMRKLRDQGTAIVFVSHRLDEVFEICDRITVLRDGELIGVRQKGETNVDEIIRMMVGRPLSALYERGASSTIGETLLEVQGLTRNRKFSDISFDVKAGEIVGLAGLVGSGRTEVARALFGTLDIDQGIVRFEGKEVHIHHPRQALAAGVIYLPEDRQHHGLVMPMSVTENTTLPIISQVANWGWLRTQNERKITQDYVEKLRIVLRSINQPVRELSGGNQQKVVISKWLLSKPKVMILDEPTRGIDIGAKSEVHHLMGELAAQGMGILMISSELPEILAMSDRILVMKEGRITGRFTKAEATAEKIMASATGQVMEGA
jgi:rhamnose transport system ATP-binding protein